MEIHTVIKDTPGLAVSGTMILMVFGLWLKRKYRSFNFSQRYGALLFILDNYELAGAALIGFGLILLAIFA